MNNFFYWFYQIDSSSHLHSSMNNSLICIKKMIPVQVLQSILVIVDHTMTSEQMKVKIYDNSKTVQLVKTQAATLCLIKVVTVTHYITSLFIPRCCFLSVLFCFLCVFFSVFCILTGEVDQSANAKQNASCLGLPLPMGLRIGRIPTVLPK